MLAAPAMGNMVVGMVVARQAEANLGKHEHQHGCGITHEGRIILSIAPGGQSILRRD